MTSRYDLASRKNGICTSFWQMLEVQQYQQRKGIISSEPPVTNFLRFIGHTASKEFYYTGIKLHQAQSPYTCLTQHQILQTTGHLCLIGNQCVNFPAVNSVLYQLLQHQT
ncbi:hypothetical protein AGOR_G00024500 [Albula goreensis]|uniref:Uncharacterized protein n=1 Tax=Albula goreensis TaxID=1534307 RepID=A0A8T3E5B3_9TELE|nr:hypothetical protein AGOR_G00024500 [Albula goreensis]